MNYQKTSRAIWQLIKSNISEYLKDLFVNPRPSHPYLHNEEKPYLTQIVSSKKGICDGISMGILRIKYQYITRNVLLGLLDNQGWWDNFPTESKQLSIQKAVKTNFCYNLTFCWRNHQISRKVLWISFNFIFFKTTRFSMVQGYFYKWTFFYKNWL